MKKKICSFLLFGIALVGCNTNPASDKLNELLVSDLFSFSKALNEGNVFGVKVEYGYIGTAPENTIIKTLESSNTDDIKYNLSILQEPLVKSEEALCGGSYRTLTFESVLNELCVIRFDNYFIHLNGIQYRLKNTPYKLPDIIEN